MKEELSPHVESKYWTSPQRLFRSRSIGGTFGIYALLEDPDVFQSVLVSSPWLIYDREQRFILKNTASFLKRRMGQDNYLYMCSGNEPNLVPQIESFAQILEANKPEGLTWTYVKMPEEDHISILARSLIEGLRAFG